MPRMLLFRIGCASYALGIEAIQEMVDAPMLYNVPQPGAFLLGVINLHGQVLPVIDLPGLLGAAGAPRDQQLVVLSPEFHSLALATSGVIENGELEEPVNLLDAGAIVERLKTLYAA